MGESQISPVVYLWGFFLAYGLAYRVFTRRRDPRWQKIWGPRLTLLHLCLIALPAVVLLIYGGGFPCCLKWLFLDAWSIRS